MAQTLKKPVNSDELSKAFAEEHSKTFEQATSHLKASTLKAAKKVTALLEAEGDVAALRLQFDSARAILKYNGFELERIEHSGNPINIYLPERDGGANGS